MTLLSCSSVSDARNYEIEIKTRLKDDLATIEEWASNLEQSKKVVNKAYLIPSNSDRNNITGLLEKYEVSAEAPYESTMLKKSVSSYDYGKKQIEWKLIINSNKLEITDGVITDKIPKGQIAVEDSLPAEIRNRCSFTMENGQQIMKITLPSPIAAEKTYLYKTEITDDSLLKNNTDYEPVNNASLSGKVSSNTGSGLCDIPETKCTASAKADYKKEVIAKKTEGRDDNFIRYSIDINRNKAKLTNLKLSDTLPDGVVLIPDSVEIVGLKIEKDGRKTEDSSISVPEKTVKFEGDSFTISLSGTITEAYRIYYKTAIMSYCTNTAAVNQVSVFADDVLMHSISASAVNAFYSSAGASTGRYEIYDKNNSNYVGGNNGNVGGSGNGGSGGSSGSSGGSLSGGSGGNSGGSGSGGNSSNSGNSTGNASGGSNVWYEAGLEAAAEHDGFVIKEELNGEEEKIKESEKITEEEDLFAKEFGIVMGAEDEGKSPSRLPKTGGFLGTVLSYGIGLLLLLEGSILVFRKKERKIQRKKKNKRVKRKKKVKQKK